MNILSYLRSKRQNTASTAKERLQIIVSHQRAHNRTGINYLPLLEQEIIDVIAKYIKIDRDQVKVSVDKAGDFSLLELNITLPDAVVDEVQRA